MNQSDLHLNDLCFNGLVLAGGQSSRMGQDKALLKCPNGETLLQRATRLLTNIGADQVFVSSHNNQVSGALRDHFPERGPVSGIHAALRLTKNTPLLVLPVDMPFITPTLLEALLNKGLSQGTSCCFKDQCLPLFIHCAGQALVCAETLLSGCENVSVWRFIKSIPTLELEIAEQGAFKNANNPLQWQECQELMR